MNEVEINPKAELAERTKNIVNKIANEEDPAKLEELTSLFKANQKKRDYCRLERLNNLQDMIDAEMMTRVESYPDAIENRELISMMTATSNAMAATSQSIEQTPVVQINNTTNTQVNVNSSGLNRESREKVMSAVNEILNSLQNDKKDNIINLDIEEK